MASLSLPRVLHPRKTSLEIERDNFEKLQTTAITKAINSHEVPVKQKHVRSAIIGTFRQQGAQVFWTIALRLPTMDDRIVAWKFCHVLHKVLREGHPLCLVHSQRHRHDLDEIGKLWGHLKEGYGKLIRLYTILLISKLDFHKRNPRFPGHLGVSQEELESIGANDINNYFEMSVEMFDYLDTILDLQAAIFGSLDMSRSNSMTSAGQCRLAPLIPCIQDASKLYDYCVKILFKLHSSLPPDTLQGHRDRFLKQFKELKQFYQNTNALQYFKDLITVPPLPENPPNFLIQANLHTYVTQEVYVPLEEEEPAEGNLIDTTDTSVDRMDNNSISPAPSQSHLDLLAERDNLIKHLQLETERLRSEIHKVVHQKDSKIVSLHDQITTLETELATRESELVQERQIKEDLFHQASTVAQTQDCEQKARDEKFNKIKDLYVKLREDHIQLLRQKAEVEKKLNVEHRRLQELEQSNLVLADDIKRLNVDHKIQSEQIQQSSVEQRHELESLKRDKELFNMETEILRKSIEDAFKENNEISETLNMVTLEKQTIETKLSNLANDISLLQNELDSLKMKSISEIKDIIIKSIEENQQIIQHAIHEIDNPALAAVSCSPDYLRSLTSGCQEALESASTITHIQPSLVIQTATRISHRHATFLLQGRATSNSSPDIMFGEKMADECKKLGECVLSVLECLREEKLTQEMVNEAKEQLFAVTHLAETISGSLQGETAENLADMMEGEMAAMDKAIEAAAKSMEDMLSKSRQADSGIKLEVNEKILDSCTTLMRAIRILIKKARLLQEEIVAQGKGTASAKEFYKRNHQWTDGFISAAKAVAVAAKFLLTAADKVVCEKGKLEQLVVASQEIAASTAQLVVASRVKANRKSNNLVQLTQASKGVTTATGGVVATVKDCSQLIDEAEELDTSNMTLHQAKRLEMDSQVRVLELEKELQQERFRLSALRRHHYQLADEGEG